MWCNLANAECPYPDIVNNHIDDEMVQRADVTAEVECATGRQLSDDTICGVAALACLGEATRINEQGVRIHA